MADFGRADALDFAQHARAVVLQHGGKELFLVVGGDLVGALRRGQHRDDDAKNRDRDDDGDRHHDAQPRAVPTGDRTLDAGV